MSEKGIIFDIKQLAIYDGPGLRTTIFFKGCPLRCRWCHNPEGLSPRPELMVSPNGCTHCGQCAAVCPHPDQCNACGRCVRACPLHLRRIAGTAYTAEELASRLLRDRDILIENGGGITLSGGEPTMQPAFALELLERTSALHRAMETCGFCPPDVFQQFLQHLDFVLMDIKFVDPALHKAWTGNDNAPILRNLEQLKRSPLPFVIRVPLIPGVNDTPENLNATAELLEDAPGLQYAELLPYHQTAGAKYEMLRRPYDPGFSTAQKPNADLTPFRKRHIPARVL